MIRPCLQAQLGRLRTLNTLTSRGSGNLPHRLKLGYPPGTPMAACITGRFLYQTLCQGAARAVCVKTFDTDTAAARLGPLVGEGTAVVSLQNGFENEEKLAVAVGEDHVMGGAAFLFAEIAAPARRPR